MFCGTSCRRLRLQFSTEHSPQLAEGLATGKLDAAFMRPEEGHPDLVYKVLITEPLMVFLPSDRPLASHETIQPSDFIGETFIGLADQAPVARTLIEHYFRRSGIDLQPAHRAEYISMLMSLVASTGGLTLAPENTRNFLTRSVISRPLAGEAHRSIWFWATIRPTRRPFLSSFSQGQTNWSRA